MKFIYFDIGNVFHTVEKVYTTAPNYFHLNPDSILEIYSEHSSELALGKITVADFWKIIQQKLEIMDGQDYDFAAAWANDYENILPMHELAKELSHKYEVGVLSNHFRGMFPISIELGKVPDLPYKSFVNSSDVGFKKPQPEIFQIAESKCGYSGQDIFFIDDQQRNLDEATRHGWQTFLFDYKNPQQSTEKLRSILLPQ